MAYGLCRLLSVCKSLYTCERVHTGAHVIVERRMSVNTWRSVRALLSRSSSVPGDTSEHGNSMKTVAVCVRE